jgi:hypothetical protein
LYKKGIALTSGNGIGLQDGILKAGGWVHHLADRPGSTPILFGLLMRFDQSRINAFIDTNVEANSSLRG